MPVVDMSGRSFDQLTVLDRAPNNRHQQAMWRCRCACGNTVVVRGMNLRDGNTGSCGCRNIPTDFSGRVFGGITILRHKTARDWWAKCACGVKFSVRIDHVMNGATRSCGCLQRALAIQRFTVHGMSHTTEHNIWLSMRQRCEKPKAHAYKDYGGRGIYVCERWRVFANFYADMGPRPKGHTLERINNDGNYEPGNCKWATPKEQARNRRNSAIIEIDGIRRCRSEVAELYGVNPITLRDRLKNGWPLEVALTRVPHKRSRIHDPR